MSPAQPLSELQVNHLGGCSPAAHGTHCTPDVPRVLAFSGYRPACQAGVSDLAHMGHELSSDAAAVGTSRLLGAITSHLGAEQRRVAIPGAIDEVLLLKEWRWPVLAACRPRRQELPRELCADRPLLHERYLEVELSSRPFLRVQSLATCRPSKRRGSQIHPDRSRGSSGREGFSRCLLTLTETHFWSRA